MSRAKLGLYMGRPHGLYQRVHGVIEREPGICRAKERLKPSGMALRAAILAQVELAAPLRKADSPGYICVDTVAHGGIINIDKETGELVTDGVREDNTVYAKHPDSGVPFKGERLPEWESLVELSRKVHALFPPHRHIAFDFAHTDKGWVLIEGNWGQLISQYVDKVGRKKEWHELMGC